MRHSDELVGLELKALDGTADGIIELNSLGEDVGSDVVGLEDGLIELNSLGEDVGPDVVGPEDGLIELNSLGEDVGSEVVGLEDGIEIVTPSEHYLALSMAQE